MNDQFERNLSATLRELSEEAIPVNLSDHALRGARRRLALAAVATVAATGIVIGAVPLAMAASRPHDGSVAPANVHAPSASASPPASGPAKPPLSASASPPASGPAKPPLSASASPPASGPASASASGPARPGGR